MQRVTASEFWQHIGHRDVHPSIEGNFPYTSRFLDRDRNEHGRIVQKIPEGSGLPVSEYFIPEGKS